MPIDYDKEYARYVRRWIEAFGTSTSGAYKIENNDLRVEVHVLQRMTKPQFIQLYTQYDQLTTDYWKSVNDGEHSTESIGKQMTPFEIKLLMYPKVER